MTNNKEQLSEEKIEYDKNVDAWIRWHDDTTFNDWVIAILSLHVPKWKINILKICYTPNTDMNTFFVLKLLNLNVETIGYEPTTLILNSEIIGKL